MSFHIERRSLSAVETLRVTEGKVCAVQVFPAREEELANPEVEVRRGRY